jgi:anti-sigma-K factor RskA
MAKAGVPAQLTQQFASSGAASQLGGVGGLAKVLANIPEQFRAMVATGLHEAFSLAIGQALWVSVAAAVVALVVTAIGLPELPLRRHHGPVPAKAPTEGDGSEPTPMAALE